jgi:hypothetical protein
MAASLKDSPAAVSEVYISSKSPRKSAILPPGEILRA